MRPLCHGTARGGKGTLGTFGTAADVFVPTRQSICHKSGVISIVEIPQIVEAGAASFLRAVFRIAADLPQTGGGFHYMNYIIYRIDIRRDV